MAPGPTLAHDLEHSHRILVSRLRLQSGTHNAKACQGLPRRPGPAQHDREGRMGAGRGNGMPDHTALQVPLPEEGKLRRLMPLPASPAMQIGLVTSLWPSGTLHGRKPP